MKSKENKKEKPSIDIVNYRVLKHWTKQGDPWYAVHDCYYSKDNPEVPHSYSATPTYLASHDEKDLKSQSDLIAKAFEREVLEFKEFDLREGKIKNGK